MDPLLIIVILFIAGIVSAILATMIGIGGGLINVPFLIFVMQLDTKMATLVSSTVIIFTSITAYINYRRDNKVDHKTFYRYIPLVVIGSIIGGFAAEFLPTRIIRQFFGLFVIASGIRGIRRIYFVKQNEEDDVIEPFDESAPNYRNIVDKDGKTYEYYVNINVGQVFALIGGMVGGMLGVGGGIIFVPVLNMISGVPIHIAAPTSIAMIIVASVITVVTRFSIIYQSGDDFDTLLYFTYAIPMIIGTVIGATIGPRRVKKLNSKQLLTLFWIAAILAGIRMLIS